jgi:hypothetical protein
MAKGAAGRYRRTVLLGVAAMAALVWTAVDQFGIDPDEMLELFLTTVIAVLATMLFGALAAAVWIGLRRLLTRLRDRG